MHVCLYVCLEHMPVFTTQRTEEILLCHTLPHSLETGSLRESEARLEGKPQWSSSFQPHRNR